MQIIYAQLQYHDTSAFKCAFCRKCRQTFSICEKVYLDRGEGAALGAARGAVLLKELPPTRPPDRAARASSGTAADRSSDAANAALASLATCDGSSSCLFWPHTVVNVLGKHTAGLLLPLRRELPRAGR